MSSILNDPIAAAILKRQPGAGVVHKSGRRDGIGQAFEDISPEATYAGFLDWGVSGPLSIVSDSPEDDVGGAGCERVCVWGLDASLQLQIKEYDMGGQDAVVTAGDNWSRVWDACAADVSSSRRVPNVGSILISSTTAGAPLMANILPGKGRLLTTNFTMPADMQGALRVVTLGAGDNKVGEIEILSSVMSAGDTNPFNLEIALPVSGGPRDVQGSFLIEPGMDVIARALSLTGTADIFLLYIIYVETHGPLTELTDLTT